MGFFILCVVMCMIAFTINIKEHLKESKRYDKYNVKSTKTTDKYDVKKTMEEIKNNNIETNTKTNDWQVINKHGFSINKMYEANPYYNPNKTDSKKLKRTREYEEWQEQMLRQMRLAHIKSLDSMHVDPNKPMKIEIEFKLVSGSDTDNPIKSFIDTLVKYYGLKDDNNFYVINASRDLTSAINNANGRIRFRITNIEKNETTGEITEVKIIQEKVEVPKVVIKEVVKEVEVPKEVVKIVEVPKEIIKEVIKEDKIYKTLYEVAQAELARKEKRIQQIEERIAVVLTRENKLEKQLEALKAENKGVKCLEKVSYTNNNKFVKTAAYEKQLEKIKQMKKVASYKDVINEANDIVDVLEKQWL